MRGMFVNLSTDALRSSRWQCHLQRKDLPSR